MDARVLFFLVALGTCWCCNARMVTTNLAPIKDGISSELRINDQQHEREDEDLCTLCEVVVAPIFDYLSNTTIQSELKSTLHLLCSLTFIVKDECNAMVDYYVPLIFSLVSSLTPEALCTQVGLCTNTSQHLSEISCEFCHHAVTEASLKLQHPNSQLPIVELLLKACNTMEDSGDSCKRLVLALIPVYAKQTRNGLALCNLLHDCSSPTNAAEQASSSETYVHSAY